MPSRPNVASAVQIKVTKVVVQPVVKHCNERPLDRRVAGQLEAGDAHHDQIYGHGECQLVTSRTGCCRAVIAGRPS